jgi:hypothetical protein
MNVETSSVNGGDSAAFGLNPVGGKDLSFHGVLLLDSRRRRSNNASPGMSRPRSHHIRQERAGILNIISGRPLILIEQ